MGALISWPDRTLTSTLSGGSWLGTASLSNLQDPQLAKVARSTNALATSTIILSDLGTALNIRLISLCAHNISAAGTVRVRGYSDSGYTTMVSGADTGTINLWTAEAIAGGIVNYPKNWTYCFSTSKTARYWKTEIVDTGNAAGYVELGRLWIGCADFEPAVSVAYNGSLDYEARDVLEEVIGGDFIGEKRTSRRVISASYPNINPVEKRKALIMKKTLTGTDELFWVMDPNASADDMLFEAFPGYFRKASALTYAYYNNNEMPFEIVERV